MASVNQIAQRVAEAEGGKVRVGLQQAKQIVRLTLRELGRESPRAVLALVEQASGGWEPKDNGS